MKTINVTIRELFNLKALRIRFEFNVKAGNINITANREILETIGY